MDADDTLEDAERFLGGVAGFFLAGGGDDGVPPNVGGSFATCRFDGPDERGGHVGDAVSGGEVESVVGGMAGVPEDVVVLGGPAFGGAGAVVVGPDDFVLKACAAENNVDHNLAIVDFAGVDMEEERAGWGEDAMGFDDARLEEADVVVEGVGVGDGGGKGFCAVTVAAESGAVSGDVADGFHLDALLGGASVEGRIDVDELHAGVGESAQSGEVFAMDDLIHETSVWGMGMGERNVLQLDRETSEFRAQRTTAAVRVSGVQGVGCRGGLLHSESSGAAALMNPREHRIGVVGAGTMGNGIAHVFARAEFRVTLFDVAQAALDRGMATVRTNLDREAAKGKIDPAAASAAFERIRPTLTLEDLGDCTFVVEAATEKLEVKQQLFRRLDELLEPDAILASNTSSISITKLAAGTGRPDRVIGMHFFNPVPIMALAELIRGLQTSDATFEATRALALEAGKTPVAVNDAAGFVSNRVLMPMINEAIFAVMEGVATAEAVDEVFRLGMAHPMGPLTLADFIGLDVCLDIMRVLEDGIGDPKYRPCPLLIRMVDAGWLGRKSGRGFYQYKLK